MFYLYFLLCGSYKLAKKYGISMLSYSVPLALKGLRTDLWKDLTSIFLSHFQGLIAGLQKDRFEFLSQVQKKLVKVIKSVGKIDHDFWRSFHNERKTEPAAGSIDGDLIEKCLDLTRDQLKEVVEGLQVSSLACSIPRLITRPRIIYS